MNSVNRHSGNNDWTSMTLLKDSEQGCKLARLGCAPFRIRESVIVSFLGVDKAQLVDKELQEQVTQCRRINIGIFFTKVAKRVKISKIQGSTLYTDGDLKFPTSDTVVILRQWRNLDNGRERGRQAILWQGLGETNLVYSVQCTE